MRFNYLLAPLLLILFCFACTKNNLLQQDNTENINDITARSEVQKWTGNPNALGCDVYRPIVMVHGFLASGDTWAKFAQYFTSNGYCNRQMYAFDWNSLGAGGGNTSALLNAFIDTVRARTGSAQVDLIGHSAGGGTCYAYLNNLNNAAKVAHYVHVASGTQSGAAGPGGSVPTLNLWSMDDLVAMGGNINGATNVMLPGLDHYQVATSAMSFYQVFQFFNGAPPPTTEIAPESIVCLGGRAVTFGENAPAANATIELYYSNPITGEREGNAITTLNADAQGRWAVQNLEGNRPMEIVVKPVTGRTIHYFREKFIRTNNFVYLRTLPGPTSPAGLLLAGLPNSANQSVVNCFSASQAVINGRDSLKSGSDLLSTNAFAAPSKTAISFFLYDGNSNNISDFTAVGLFGSFTFLSGIDVFYNPTTAGPVSFQLNGRTLNIRKIPSNTGIEVVVFD
jgi:pimeloyl-ACP methyl ester carboxylesterase